MSTLVNWSSSSRAKASPNQSDIAGPMRLPRVMRTPQFTAAKQVAHAATARARVVAVLTHVSRASASSARICVRAQRWLDGQTLRRAERHSRGDEDKFQVCQAGSKRSPLGCAQRQLCLQ